MCVHCAFCLQNALKLQSSKPSELNRYLSILRKIHNYLWNVVLKGYNSKFFFAQQGVFIFLIFFFVWCYGKECLRFRKQDFIFLATMKMFLIIFVHFLLILVSRKTPYKAIRTQSFVPLIVEFVYVVGSGYLGSSLFRSLSTFYMCF